ncbi:cysteine hydrolase [Candidatus Saccharibacteria bacterium]|nr:MAG: cysteine hydrolase [Candidatus Saccharibacteria bacterium]
MAEKHPSGIPEAVLNKVVPRRGRLHAFPILNPAKTALVVVDLDTGSVTHGTTEEIRSFVPRVNSLANTVREHGGTVAWVTTPISAPSKHFRALYGDAFTKLIQEEGADGGTAHTVWHELNALPGDVYATKKGASAFFPGRSNLDEQLQKRGVTSLLIAGLVTNVCCESSARDACELEYEVTMVSDCLLGHKEGQHEATLATFYRNFGDVRPSENIQQLITESAQ